MVITKNRKASDARPEPIGVKFLTGPVDVPDHPPVFRGTSFCQAVHQAGSEALLLSEGSIDTCRGSPVVLGLTAPGNGFERGLEPRLEDTWGVYLANLTSFGEKGLEPDVVILRDTPQNLGILVEAIGEAGCAMQYAGQTDKSALTIFFGGKGGWRSRLISIVNRIFAALNNLAAWRKITDLLFRSAAIYRLFARIGSACMADMSMCRNSSVIPESTGKANVSHFCAGGIAWGLNRPERMTMGIPYNIYRNLPAETEEMYPKHNR